MKIQVTFFIASILIFAGCRQKYDEGTFGYDVALLKSVNGFTLLKSGDAMMALSGAYQGRVFTSTSDGMGGKSLGWFNRKIIQQGNSAHELSKLGGEGRFWFGPEIGKYAIFFDPGAEQNADNIHISPELDSTLFHELRKTPNSVSYGSAMQIRNASGYVFHLFVRRKITLKSKQDIQRELGVPIDDSIKSVAFSTTTRIRNTGNEPWHKETGLLSIWDIGCMLASKNTVVVIPLTKDTSTVTDYFTPLDSTRIKVKDRVVYYKADAGYMNKIGVKPTLCKGVFGCYNPDLHLLTVVTHSLDSGTFYVNSLWGNHDPYRGDAVNVFNGEVNPATDRDWPFFEMESSSAVKELGLDEEMVHRQSIYHFVGNENDLNPIAEKVLGVSLSAAQTMFN